MVKAVLVDQSPDYIVCPMRLKSNDQALRIFTVTQLSKHHFEHLILASEMFHISVAIILENIVIELSPV